MVALAMSKITRDYQRLLQIGTGGLTSPPMLMGMLSVMCCHGSNMSVFTPTECGSMTEWERQKEWKEFTRAARVYQPLAISLASKFTRAQAEEVGGDKMEKLKVCSPHKYTYCTP